ncbi:Rpn family recombination-promoting nuclease/putative transposase [Coprococcus catus]|jgi:predicted transposase/invertase (TIGR01784 family)|uniref:Rpn family recombination-promoting nuclease/putative transposase n=1 Tax=Coprococcus catus TaxID=116085 RepID=A0A3E2XK64_9FIRM|nr:Rpn family recombination-promoting nuclease/putative transposase [Coprococcus catus]RGC45466.1 Rpn family recombination-promoting nuclease/putative transposase [Coprococcus catus]
MKKTFQELTIKDPFMFAATMSDEEQCKAFLEIVLEMEIAQVSVITEKTIAYHPEYHGIRLDVLAVEEGINRRFNVEMQVKDKKNLPKRSRYYHSQLDMDALLTGVDYNHLPDTYVIFICDYDPFGDRLYRYTICNHCKENDKDVDDGDYTIWLSSKGNNVAEESGELVKFLQYVEDPEKESDSEGEFVKSLKEQIAAIKRNREWEGRFMLLEEMIADEREEAMAEGHAKGLAEGEQLTLQKMNRLTQLLAKQNRIDDLVKAANDADYQEQLFKEFHL